MFTLYMVCARVDKNKWSLPGPDVVISVDLIQYDNIKLVSLSAKCLESAVFWHMNLMARQIKIWIHQISQQAYTFSS